MPAVLRSRYVRSTTIKHFVRSLSVVSTLYWPWHDDTTDRIRKHSSASLSSIYVAQSEM